MFAYALLAMLQEQEVGWDLITMWHNMGYPAKTVVGILFIMSAWSVGIMIDRALMYSAARKQSRVFVQQVAGALKDNKLDEAISIAERNKKSHIAKVVATGLSEFQAASSQVSDEEVIEAAKRGLERSVAIVHAEMKRGLSGLATIGSTAPFVGLFGTVMGIINAFKGISNQKVTGLSAVAGGIAEALVTTALGLLVAVPAVWTFNYFTNRVEAFDVEMDNSSMELINYFIIPRGGRKEAMLKVHAAPVMASPNVIPMADIMLVLLIIFMVITPMLQKGVTVDMAKAQNAQDMQAADKDDAVIIAVTRDGKTFLGNREIGLEEITNDVRDLISDRLDKTVYIRSDSRAKYGDVVKAVDEVRSAGVDNLGLLTQKIQTSKP